MQPLKPLAEQCVVITGASSGIGRETALRCAARGARVVLASRDEESLEDLATIIRTEGGRATAIPADVSDWEQVQALARGAADAFGAIDTWVNNAAVTVYGRFEQIPLDEYRRVMDINFVGQLHGARAALPYLREEGRGAIIFVGSALSDRAVPLQSPYCASKHAVKAMAESLRVELAKDAPAVQVTLIKPSSMNTPLFDEARTHTGYRPKPVSPVYEATIAADAIVHSCEHREREITVGGGAALLTSLEAFAGPVLDWWMKKTTPQSQQTEEPKSEAAPNNLEHPVPLWPQTEGSYPGRTFSVYTWLQTRPPQLIGAGAAAVGAIGITRFLRRDRRRHAHDHA